MHSELHGNLVHHENELLLLVSMTLFSYVHLCAFGCVAIVNTSKEAYPWPLIVLCYYCLASFTEAP